MGLHLQEKYSGALLGLAVGDALGMPTESKTIEEIKATFRVVRSYKDGYLPAGCYTDDTQQAILLAESLLENKGFDKNSYVRKLIDRTDLRRGIGHNLGRFILQSRELGKPAYEILQPVYPSNGLAMKIAPAALYHARSPEKINPLVEELGEITHRHPGSVAGAVGIAQAVHYALLHTSTKFSREEFLELIVKETGKYDETLAGMIRHRTIVDEGDANAYYTVPIALLTFADNPSDFESGLIALVNSGGDTDTKAAMFGAISGAFNGTAKIPPPLLEGLENGREGRDYIMELARRLYGAT